MGCQKATQHKRCLLTLSGICLDVAGKGEQGCLHDDGAERAALPAYVALYRLGNEANPACRSLKS